MIMTKMTAPFSNYGLLDGQLFLYAGGRAAFETSPIQDARARGVGEPSSDSKLSTKKCILLGGLSDGLLPVPYTQILADACLESQWSLVQPIISSSYTGFGHGSLERDCNELEELMRYLIDYRNAEEFCLIGHSTGCQDAVYFLKNAEKELCEKLRVVGLQAPVSDRESASMHDGYEENLKVAQALIYAGKAQEMMPRSAFWAPITAQRFVDLNAKGGEDDFFSSDYTDDDLAARLGHVGSDRKSLRVLVAFSGADEYVPLHVDKRNLLKRLVSAMNIECPQEQPVARSLYLENGNHNLSEGAHDGSTFVKSIAEIMMGSSELGGNC